jgi:hypothetical protein
MPPNLIRIAAMLAVGASSAAAWGSRGHQVVGQIAEARLSPAAKQKLRGLLGSGTTLASVANCADQVREGEPQAVCLKGFSTRRPDSAPWHFIDIQIDSQALDMARDCPAVGCVISKIEEFQQILKTATDRKKRIEALMFLVHFLGDMHQPLHCSDNHDRGGNDTRVYLGGSRKNLHQVWDVNFVEDLVGYSDLGTRLLKDITEAQAGQWKSGTPRDWANEAFGLGKTYVYGALSRTTPIGLSDAYVDQAENIVEEQLKKAGVRLAAVLEAALNGR